MTSDELRTRTAEWGRLGEVGLVDIAERSGALLLRYRRDPEVEAMLRYLVDQETRCCSSLRFEISPTPGELTLEISGPWRESPWAAVSPVKKQVSPSGDIRELVRERYAAVARGLGVADEPVSGTGEAGCGATYDPEDIRQVQEIGSGLSLGCGNSVGAAELKEGETVLDLGAGAGLDVLVAARRVGSSGKVYGLDMTDEMLELAEANRSRTGLENAEFLKGYIEKIPLPDSSVDVVISNCVINLSASKPGVFAEMFRVLKAGGRLSVSDVVADREADAVEAPDLQAWGSCRAGALTPQQYRSGLHAAGFRSVTLSRSHEIQPGYTSVVVRARKL